MFQGTLYGGIVAELEQQPHGPYTGAMEYLNHDGSMDLSILVRAFEMTNDYILFRAGAGIVADSNLHCKLDNTLSILDRGLQYGDGLFESITIINGKHHCGNAI